MIIHFAIKLFVWRLKSFVRRFYKLHDRIVVLSNKSGLEMILQAFIFLYYWAHVGTSKFLKNL